MNRYWFLPFGADINIAQFKAFAFTVVADL